MESKFNNTPPRQPETEREETARLKFLEQHVNNLQALILAGRKDSDFDLFWRRVQMAEMISRLPLDAMKTIYLTDFYTDFWRLAGEAYRRTKFAQEEKNISRQILEQARAEKNPVRRQYFALALIVFGEFAEAQRLIDLNLCPFQLRQDLETFAKWTQILSTNLPPQARAAIARNEQIFDFLQEKYSALIKKYSRAVINAETCPPVKDYQIYFCWLQGEENLPPIVRCCYNSLKQNAGHYKIVFVDEKNFSDYVDIAPHIMEKFRAGKISRTHFSDILRINLLERYGGLWLDATVLVTEPLENYKNLLAKIYFTQRFHGEKNYRNTSALNVAYGRWSGNMQGSSVLHNPLFAFAKEIFNDYWLNFDEMIDYFLIDFTMALAYENIPVVRKEIDDVPINNTGVFFIQNHLNAPYAAYPFDKILQGNFLHKLNWRIPLDMTRDDTVFREIQRRYS